MVIKNLTDTDFYKFTMAQVVLHQYPATIVKYEFKCRNGIDLAPYVDEINKEIDNLCSLKFSKNELGYLLSIPFLKPDFIEYLRLLQLNRRYIKAYVEDGELKITIEGPWISTIWFEVPVLAIVSEVYSKHQAANFKAAENRLKKKVDYLNRQNRFFLLKYFKFADFGTRRRFSYLWQLHTITYFLSKLKKPMLVGTSNVNIAMKLGVTPIGTMAHEFIQAHQQLGVRLEDSQQAALQTWANEYRGHLGIALTDTVGMDAFLRDFDLYFAKLFDGCRHDSGDPYTWCYKLINHYNKLDVDPRTKTAIFSDGLNLWKAASIYKRFKDSIRVSFGIGTNLTNDMGIKAPSIVIKMVECNGRPVAKISDSAGKGMCKDEAYLSNLKKVYNI